MGGLNIKACVLVIALLCGVYLYAAWTNARYEDTLALLAQAQQEVKSAHQTIERLDADRQRLDALLVEWGRDTAVTRRVAEERAAYVQAIRAGDDAAKAWLDMPLPDSVRRLFAPGTNGARGAQGEASRAAAGANSGASGE